MKTAQGDELTVLRVPAKVFDDGMMGIKTKTQLAEGDYEAIVVLRHVAPPKLVSASVGESVEQLEVFIERMRREHVQMALERVGGNRTQAATLLDVDVRTIFRFVEKLEKDER
jgi:transcriptional regulator with PAS, ATPase and Fis domain